MNRSNSCCFLVSMGNPVVWTRIAWRNANKARTVLHVHTVFCKNELQVKTGSISSRGEVDNLAFVAHPGRGSMRRTDNEAVCVLHDADEGRILPCQRRYLGHTGAGVKY